MEEIGPVDYAIIAFPGNNFKGEIAPAIADLVDSGTIRIIDLTFVMKDADGSTMALELNDFDPEVAAGFEKAGFSVDGLFNEEDVQAAAEELEPGSSAALIVWENLWAKPFATAARAAGGELLEFGRLPHDVVQAAREWAAAQNA